MRVCVRVCVYACMCVCVCACPSMNAALPLALHSPTHHRRPASGRAQAFPPHSHSQAIAHAHRCCWHHCPHCHHHKQHQELQFVLQCRFAVRHNAMWIACHARLRPLFSLPPALCAFPPRVRVRVLRAGDAVRRPCRHRVALCPRGL